MPDAFYNMRPGDYYAMVDGYNLRTRGESERMRTHAFVCVMPNLKEGYSYSRFCSEIWPLPGDRRHEAQKIVATQEEINEIFKAHKLIK